MDHELDSLDQQQHEQDLAEAKRLADSMPRDTQARRANEWWQRMTAFGRVNRTTGRETRYA